MLVGLGHLTQERIGLHVLDVSLNERSPLLDGFDDHLLTSDRLIDERVLRWRRFARSREIVVLLLLSMQKGCSCLGGESCCDEECQGETGGGLFPENHVVLLRLTRGQPEYELDASACCDNRMKIMFLIQRVEMRH